MGLTPDFTFVGDFLRIHVPTDLVHFHLASWRVFLWRQGEETAGDVQLLDIVGICTERASSH